MVDMKTTALLAAAALFAALACGGEKQSPLPLDNHMMNEAGTGGTDSVDDPIEEPTGDAGTGGASGDAGASSGGSSGEAGAGGTENSAGSGGTEAGSGGTDAGGAAGDAGAAGTDAGGTAGTDAGGTGGSDGDPDPDAVIDLTGSESRSDNPQYDGEQVRYLSLVNGFTGVAWYVVGETSGSDGYYDVQEVGVSTFRLRVMKGYGDMTLLFDNDKVDPAFKPLVLEGLYDADYKALGPVLFASSVELGSRQ